MTSPFDLDAVLGELTGRTAAERQAEQAEIGGALRALGISQDPGQGAGVYVAGLSSGLLVPTDSRRAPIDYIGVYTTLSDYYPAEALGLSPSDIAEGVIRIFCAQAPRDWLIELLVILNRGMGYPEVLDAFLDEHRRSLHPDVAARFENALKAEHKVPVAPQVVLAALRHVLAMDELDVVGTVPPESLVMTFVHAIAEGLAANTSVDEEKVAGLPITLAMDMVRNAIFNEHDDTYSGIARQLRLWRDYANTDGALVDGRHPAELARNAIGIEVEDFLALGFALMSHAMAWRPGQPLYMSEHAFPSLDPAVLEKFLAVVAMSPEQMKDALRTPRSQWDFLLFQQRPVLRMPGGLMVIDVGLLFERVTAGLYWDVHDYLKATEGEHSREQWTWAWGAIVEAMIEDELSALAPALLDGTKFIWDEDDLQRAYGQRSKRADQVIDAGRALVATDVVSGQLTVPTRIDGKPEAFKADLNKLVFEKAHQVHETAMNLIRDESALTGVSPEPHRPVYPVVAIGSSFARNPVVANLIEEYIRNAGLLSYSDARIKPLSVIDVSEVEVLEGLAANLGCAITDLLDGWHDSGIANMSLRNYLIDRFPDHREAFRAPRLHGRVDEAIEELIGRLGLRDEQPPETSAP